MPFLALKECLKSSHMAFDPAFEEHFTERATHIHSLFLRTQLNRNRCKSYDCHNMFLHFCMDYSDICFRLKKNKIRQDVEYQ